MIATGGDRGQVASYLAESHHLSQCEAEEALDDWLIGLNRPGRSSTAP
ncbi:hypothetical protein [Palleronia caenipelagi]|nr:hypothetical protein [Palleronia caenipelagi]